MFFSREGHDPERNVNYSKKKYGWTDDDIDYLIIIVWNILQCLMVWLYMEEPEITQERVSKNEMFSEYDSAIEKLKAGTFVK